MRTIADIVAQKTQFRRKAIGRTKLLARPSLPFVFLSWISSQESACGGGTDSRRRAAHDGDVERLGENFNRLWPVDETPCFSDLLRAIDEADRELWRSRDAARRLGEV